MTAFVMRLLLFLYIPLVIATFSAPIWAYSALPISVTLVSGFSFSSLLSPSLFLTVLGRVCLWVSFSMSSSLFCLGSFEPLDFSVVFCLPFPGYQAVDRVTKGVPVSPQRAPQTLSRVLDRSSAGLQFRGLARWPHLRECLPVAVGLGESSPEWMCGGVQTAGPGAPAVSVITFFLPTVPTVVSIGCDILIK